MSMFCCCCCCNPKRTPEDKSKQQILDVKKILADFVWRSFLERNVRFRCFVRRSNYEVDVPMNYLRFETIDQKEDPQRKSDEANHNALGSGRDGEQGAVELKTVFCNETPNEQTYHFRLEKTRKSTLTVTMQKGYTIGGKANLSLKLPPVTGSVGVGLNYSVTNTKGEVIEETATFETRSDVTVKDSSRCEAKVTLKEIDVDCGFKMRVIMSLATEGLPVTVKRKRDGKVFYVHIVSDLGRVFKHYKSEIVDPYPDFDKVYKDGVAIGNHSSGLTGDRVLFKVRGTIQGSRLADQSIALKSISLSPSAEQSQSDSQPASS